MELLREATKKVIFPATKALPPPLLLELTGTNFLGGIFIWALKKVIFS